MMDRVMENLGFSLETRIAILQKTGAKIDRKKLVIEKPGIPGLCNLIARAINVLRMSENAVLVFCKNEKIGEGEILFENLKRFKEEKGDLGAGILFVALSTIEAAPLSEENHRRVSEMIQKDNSPSLRLIIDMITKEDADNFLTAFLDV